MNLLVMENVTKGYGEKALFNAVSLGIHEGDKIGIIGINGTGKSTLLKILAGLTEPDGGQVIRGNRVRTAYLPQTPVFSEEVSILDYVLAGREADGEAWMDDSTAKSLLTRLGFTDLTLGTAALSGGERKRVALARTLLNVADAGAAANQILILDEPTNHLDSDMVLWLEDYLASWRGVLVLVTHDRYFLDRVTNKIVEIDHGSLYTYEANYSGYLEQRQQRIETSLAADTKRANLLRTELAWLHRGARARSTKQKAHIQRIEELQNTANTVLDRTVEMDSVASRMGKKTIEIRDVSKSYDGRLLFEDFSYTVLRGERIGIIGKNGCGKSTLMRILTGREAPDTGSVTLGETIRVGYFTQENEDMDGDRRVIDYIRDVAEIIHTSRGTATASQMLERFLFPPTLQYTPVRLLSGGEKRRLYLLRILMSAPNVLILDEPTNDLDIATLTTLEDYLDYFDGIVITVSHDRYFLDRTVNRIFAFEGTHIVQYEGGYTDYFQSPRRPENQLPPEEAAAKPSSGETARKNEGRAHEQKLRFSFKEKQEFDTIEDDIAALEERVEALTAEMETCASQYTRLQELMSEKEAAETELAEKMDRWVYLTDLAEKIEAQNIHASRS
ncbi:MAG: ABC-F family ATP-binding cassette domain-containing protein [Lachnospiraceae bacterium]|nr:ABC-F family ATP-binding cassette domain-containing protein [Lachnospiraceae bacterium]